MRRYTNFITSVIIVCLILFVYLEVYELIQKIRNRSSITVAPVGSGPEKGYYNDADNVETLERKLDAVVKSDIAKEKFSAKKIDHYINVMHLKYRLLELKTDKNEKDVYQEKPILARRNFGRDLIL